MFKRKSRISCNFADKNDIKNVEGLVDSKMGLLSAGTEKVPVGSSSKMVEVVPTEEPAKVIRLMLTGYPTINYEYLVYPVDDMDKLCKDISSFYLKDGIFYTDKYITTYSQLSKAGRLSTKPSDFPKLDASAARDFHEGKSKLHTIDERGVVAVSNLKKIFSS